MSRTEADPYGVYQTIGGKSKGKKNEIHVPDMLGTRVWEQIKYETLGNQCLQKGALAPESSGRGHDVRTREKLALRHTLLPPIGNSGFYRGWKPSIHLHPHP